MIAEAPCAAIPADHKPIIQDDIAKTKKLNQINIRAESIINEQQVFIKWNGAQFSKIEIRLR
jgi:hypothetical protein